MKLFHARLPERRTVVLAALCLLFCIGAGLGFLVCRAVMPREGQELETYLRQYAQISAQGGGPAASVLSTAAAYLRYPLAALLLGFTAAGLVLLPLLWVAQGFFLSFSLACFASALGRSGVYLALAAFGPRCLFVLPCTLYLTVQGLSTAAARRGQRLEGFSWRPTGLCCLALLLGIALELRIGPDLLGRVIAGVLST